MAKRRKISLGDRLFSITALVFIVFTFFFVFFQQRREKTYRIEILNTRLQVINNEICDNFISKSKYVPTGRNAQLSIRVTVMESDGKILYDNKVKDLSTLDDHSTRIEITNAIKEGSSYGVLRESKTLGGKWFYSATLFPDEGIIVRTAVPYDSPLGLNLTSDKGFVWIAILLSVALLLLIFLSSRHINQSISQLYSFADMAASGRDISNIDMDFPKDELGDISSNIISLYAQLQNSEDDKTRLKRQITQNVAHELKTPVSSIRGYLETLSANPDMDPQMRIEFIRKCSDQSIRLAGLINDITLISRMDDAAGVFEREDIDVRDILDEIAADTAKIFAEKGMKLLILVGPNTMVKGNRQLLYSIFRNLTDNALAYSGNGSVVTVQCPKVDSERVYFVFNDNGDGVPKEHLPHLFERFYRVDKGRSRKLGGTGLGLAIVKNAVLLHGGTIKAGISSSGGLEFAFSIARSKVSSQ